MCPAAHPKTPKPAPITPGRTCPEAQNEATTARANGEYVRAAECYQEAILLTQNDSTLTPQYKQLIQMAFTIGCTECHALREEWWDVVRTVDIQGVAGAPAEALAMSFKLYALGAMRLGLVDLAKDILQAAQEKAGPTQKAEVAALCAEFARRAEAIADGSGLAAEVGVLATAFGEGASSLLSGIEAECMSSAGRSMLHQQGFSESSDSSGSFVLRAQHRRLTYQVKKTSLLTD